MYSPRPPFGQDIIAHITYRRFPCGVNELPSAPFFNNFYVRLPNNRPGWPEFVVTRLDLALGGRALAGLYSAFKGFMATRPKVNGKLIREEARSDVDTTVFFHLGTWSKCSPRMMITKDTSKQNAESKAALRNLLQKLQSFAIPKLSRLLRNFIPSHFYVTDQ